MNPSFQLVGDEDEIEYVYQPVAIHVAFQTIRPEPPSHQSQIQDIHNPVAVHVGGVFCRSLTIKRVDSE